MPRKISKAQLKAMEARGAKVVNKPEAPAPLPAAPVKQDQTPEVASALADLSAINNDSLQKTQVAIQELALSLGDGQMMLAEKLRTMVIDNQNTAKDPLPYRFEVTRDRKGLIEFIDAYPIMED